MRTFEETEELVIRIFREVLLASDVELDSTVILSDLDMDSLDKFEIGMHIEDFFNISVDDDSIAKWVTINDITNYVKRCLDDNQL